MVNKVLSAEAVQLGVGDLGTRSMVRELLEDSIIIEGTNE
jgi:hypothetical protein